jgi:hypothetical protein
MNNMKPLRALGDLKRDDLQQCIPVALAGWDICSSAVTGSGKAAVCVCVLCLMYAVVRCNAYAQQLPFLFLHF